MAKEVVNYTGESLRTTYEFTGKRDAEVARRTVAVFKDKYSFGGDSSREQLLTSVSSKDRIVIFRETAGLSNQDAALAGLIPQEYANSTLLIMPERAYQEGIRLPFVGAFLPPLQLEAATKLSIHEVAPDTKAALSPRLQSVQAFGKILREAYISSVLDGWTAVDVPGADYAAQDLLSQGGNVIIKYGRGSLGQDQWTFHDEESYHETMREIESSMKKRNINWQNSGLVFERKLGVHDQFVVGQLNFMGQLISWVGRMDHAPVKTVNGEKETIYTGSSKIFALGTLADLEKLPLPPEAIEDIEKARQFGAVMEDHVAGGAVTRVHYNLLRGVIETNTDNTSQPTYLSGISEITLRGGGGSGAEARVVQALASNKTNIFEPASEEDQTVVTEQNGMPIVVGSTYLEYYPAESEYRSAAPLQEGSEVLYDGTDPKYGFVRIYTRLHPVSDVGNSKEELKKFLYPNISSS